jgi:hypothetical protein
VPLGHKPRAFRIPPRPKNRSAAAAVGRAAGKADGFVSSADGID